MPGRDMQFNTEDGPRQITPRRLIIAGWTGRDTAAVHHHIDELALLGVAPPTQTPLYYRVSGDLLTQAPKIEVLGQESSGEAEPMLIALDDRHYLGLGSDHTDRGLEAHSVAASKQACAKPCAADLWELGPLFGHCDAITIRSWIREDGSWTLYQQGSLAQILPLQTLRAESGLETGDVMFCGTFAALGGVRPAQEFRAEMHDPVRDRTMSLAYRAAPLPVIS